MTGLLDVTCLPSVTCPLVVTCLCFVPRSARPC